MSGKEAGNTKWLAASLSKSLKNMSLTASYNKQPYPHLLLSGCQNVSFTISVDVSLNVVLDGQHGAAV